MAPQSGAVKQGAATFAAAAERQAYYLDPAQASAAQGDEIYGRLVHMIMTTIDQTSRT